MEEIELSVTLREMACNQPTPLCGQWTKEWQDDTDIDTLLEKFVRGQDFCIKNNFPPLDFCRKNFNKEDLHRHLIYIDEEVDLSDADSGTYVFIGECTGKVRFRNFSVGNLYVRHTSYISVVSEDMAKVFVSIYDDAMAELDTMDCSTAKLYDRRK